MQSGKVVMQSERLDKKIILWKFFLHGFHETRKHSLTLCTSFYSPMPGSAKRHILVFSPEHPWRAVIIIRSSDDPLVNSPDQIDADRPVVRE